MTFRQRVVDIAGTILGVKQARPLATVMAQAGLRGLGVNLNHDFAHSGEAWLLRRMFAELKRTVVMDVGANVGEYALKARALGAAYVYAFEPAADTFALLLDATRADASIEAHQLALGEIEGTTSFFTPIDPTNSVYASRDVGATPLAREQMTEVSIPMTTLDNFVAERALTFDVLKIDVEGFELEVIKGAAQSLAAHPPKLIHFEFNSHHGIRHQTLSDFATLLPDYKLFRLAAASLRPLDIGYYLSTIYAYQNIICLHAGATDLLAALT